MRDPRREYIRLLQRSVDQFTPEPGEKRDATLIGELADAEYVKGSALPDASGVTRGAASWGVTVAGRLFLRKLEKEVREGVIFVASEAMGPSGVSLCCRRSNTRSE